MRGGVIKEKQVNYTDIRNQSLRRILDTYIGEGEVLGELNLAVSTSILDRWMLRESPV